MSEQAFKPGNIVRVNFRRKRGTFGKVYTGTVVKDNRKVSAKVKGAQWLIHTEKGYRALERAKVISVKVTGFDEDWASK